MGGRIIVLNGASSAGKTSIAKELQRILDQPFLHAQVDSYAQMLPPALSAQCLNAVEPRVRKSLVDSFHLMIRTLAEEGNNVIVDHVLGEQEEWVRHFVLCLKGADVVFIKVDCLLDELLLREARRTDRMSCPDVAKEQHGSIHEYLLYDGEIDSTNRTPSECAGIIARFLEKPVLHAFGELKKRFAAGAAGSAESTEMRRNVLLAGGTSETDEIAGALVDEGCFVIVCTATDLPLKIPDHPAVIRRSGRMTEEQFAAFIVDNRIACVVNAAHPYAVEVRKATRAAAAAQGIPHIEFVRPASGDAGSMDGAILVSDHSEAAQMAVKCGRKILLTTGVNHVAIYAQAAREAGADLLVRVLPGDESTAACRAAGLRDDQIITSRGLPGVEDTEALIREHGIGVLVTKESGAAGGFPAKMEAVRRTGCSIVIVSRPLIDAAGGVGSVKDLIELVRNVFRTDYQGGCS